MRRSGLGAGDRAFLRQRHERGVVASGSFTSEIFFGQHWEDLPREMAYAEVQWDVLLPIEDGLPVADLKRFVPGVTWDRLQGSGVLVRPADGAAIKTAWAEHVSDTPYRTPEEIPPGTYEEGGVTRTVVNRYERDRAARAACIQYHGTTCVVCGFNFEHAYGPLGQNLIHAHHLKEISTFGPGYKIDPVKEMRPLCANCHSMVHRTRPALTLEQLKAKIR